eukprot:gene8471-9378_t
MFAPFLRCLQNEADPQAHVSKIASGEEVRTFLERNNLSHYVNNFLNEGYDDLSQIVEMVDKYSELESLTKDVQMFQQPGHRKRFVAAIQILASKTQHSEPVKVEEKPEAVQDVVNDRSKWPSIAKKLWILNPVTQQLIFYNNVLTEMYGSSFEIMAPLEFKDYVTSQRITRWKIEKDLTHLMQRAQNILSAESKDGRAQNVARFSGELMRTVRPGDSFKAESSRNVIQHMLHEVALKLQEIKVQEAIITNINLLKRRTNSTTEQDAEAKRQKKSSARNARKSMKEKEERLQKSKGRFAFTDKLHVYIGCNQEQRRHVNSVSGYRQKL